MGTRRIPSRGLRSPDLFPPSGNFLSTDEIFRCASPKRGKHPYEPTSSLFAIRRARLERVRTGSLSTTTGIRKPCSALAAT
jgi:hypothetical protein